MNIKNIEKLCSVPKYLRSHWPTDLLVAIEAYEELERRAVVLSERLDFLEEILEEREYCNSVLAEYRNKFLSEIDDKVYYLTGKSRAVKLKRKKGACRT